MRNTIKIANHYEFNTNMMFGLPGVVYMADNYEVVYFNDYENQTIHDAPQERTSSNEYMQYLMALNDQQHLELWNTYGCVGLNEYVDGVPAYYRIVSYTQAQWNSLKDKLLNISDLLKVKITETLYNSLQTDNFLYACGSATDTYQFNIFKGVVFGTYIQQSGSTTEYYADIYLIDYRIFGADKPPIEYTLEFDIKFPSESTGSAFQTYFYNSCMVFAKTKSNGSSTNNQGGDSMTNFNVRDVYTHCYINFIPVYQRNIGIYDRRYISVYCTYNTGRIPTVRNVSLKLTKKYNSVIF